MRFKLRYILILWIAIQSTCKAQDTFDVTIDKVISFDGNPVTHLVPFKDSYIVINNSNTFSWVFEDTIIEINNQFSFDIKKVIPEENSILVAGLISKVPFEYSDSYQNLPTGNILRLFPDGTYDYFGDGVNGTIRDVVIWDGKLVIIGDFTSSGSSTLSKIASWNSTQKVWQQIPIEPNDDVRAITVYDSKLLITGLFKRNSDKVYAALLWDGTAMQVFGQELEQVRVKQALTNQSSATLLGKFKFLDSDTVYQVIQYKNAEWKPIKNPNGIVDEMIAIDSTVYVRGTFSKNSYIAKKQNDAWVFPDNQPDNEIRSFYADPLNKSLILNGLFKYFGAKEIEFIANWNEREVKAFSLPDSMNYSNSLFKRGNLVSDGSNFAALAIHQGKTNYSFNSFDFVLISKEGDILKKKELNRLNPNDYNNSAALLSSEGSYYLNAIGSYIDRNVFFKIDVEQSIIQPWYDQLTEVNSTILATELAVVGKNNQIAFTVNGSNPTNLVQYKDNKLLYISGFKERDYYSNKYFKKEFNDGEKVWKNNSLCIWVNQNQKLEEEQLSNGIALIESEIPVIYSIPASFPNLTDFATLFDWAGDEILIRLQTSSYDTFSSNYLLFNTITKQYRRLPFSLDAQILETDTYNQYVFLTGYGLTINAKSSALFVSDGDNVYLPNFINHKLYDNSTIAIADDGTFAFYPAIAINELDSKTNGIAIGSFNNLPLVEVKKPQVPTLKVSAYPNPFNPTSTLSLQIEQNSFTEIKIYDSLGRLMSTLFSGDLSLGKHEFTIRANSWASGLYIYQVKTNSSIQTGKIMLIK